MARKFLYIFAFLIVLTLGALVAMRVWSDELTRLAFVPTAEFVEQAPLEENAYQNPDMWFARPGMEQGQNPARWQPSFIEANAEDDGDRNRDALKLQEAAAQNQDMPEDESKGGTAMAADGAEPAPAAAATSPAPATDAKPPRFAVFFVHPTSYLEKKHWNAPLDDIKSQQRAQIFVRGLASPFNQAREIWAPRYRQAAFGAFLTDAPEAGQAIDAAYQDVEQAFDYFVQNIPADMPIVLAGHSQGSLHILHLLKDRIAGTPLQNRIAMVYPIGWPVSVEHDLPALGLPACETPDQGGCIVTWSSFGEPANPGPVMDIYGESPGYDGQLRGDSPILCVNPLSGTLDGDAPASANVGTLVPNDALTSGELVAGAVPARCDGQGLLLIGDPPDLGPYTLPGNNYHVYDIPLFWMNLQQDVARRVSAWARTH
ncbi:DUF3089 domain-containing protein [Altericroceibacterium spongiae]|uniref:DUF3089 domain-containing protein n=1 Tax=Altericroceibacterium spongiae TaxID=2320269 RepID=A0A420EJX7_9SPHN|nr:DUF3089 domain-containing protein [Altericroceibacterium spongiae]RKF20977.1 DUF3089 domain-containing protein [Altericroceibacterium spongiae]